MQRFTPMLVYADAPAALAFLAEAFGFEERSRMDMPDGSVGHAEVAFGDQVVMVDDVDAHHARARAAGATIAAEPADQEYGERTYRAIDPEGQRWIFGAPVRSAA
jgi:uncharacterized glyoxalase superfamily protein PhnB